MGFTEVSEVVFSDKSEFISGSLIRELLKVEALRQEFSQYGVGTTRPLCLSGDRVLLRCFFFF